MQYLDLNQLLSRYGDSGFRIVGFPCNQFGYQEPGVDDEIMNGITNVRPGKNFKPHEKFILTNKIEVNGKAAHPLYKYLKDKCPPGGPMFGPKAKLFWDEMAVNDIHWNFEKFLIDKRGRARYRFDPEDWDEGKVAVPFIEQLLKET